MICKKIISWFLFSLFTFHLSPLFAVTFTENDTILEAPADGGLFDGGLQYPSVIYDEDSATYFLYFSSPSTEDKFPEACTQYSTIGRATSPDGITWTLDANPVLYPRLSSWEGCSVTQPAVIAFNNQFYMWFVGGVGVSRGIGFATSEDGISWDVKSPRVVDGTAWSTTLPGRPLISLGSASPAVIGELSATMLDNIIYLYYVLGDDIYLAYSQTLGHSWTTDLGSVLSPDAAISWMSSALSNTSANCDETYTSDDVRLFFQGIDSALNSSIALTTAENALDFTLSSDSPFNLSSGSTTVEWNQWNVLEDVSGNYLAYYSKTDAATGLDAIGLAVSGPLSVNPPNWTRLSDRVCNPELYQIFGTNDTTTSNSYTGRSVARAGDVDGDGFQDFLIGAPYYDPTNGSGGNYSNAGMTYLVFGHQDLRDLELENIGTEFQGVKLYSTSVNYWSGFAVDGAGDVNDDGFDDIIIGAPTLSANTYGYAYLIYGPLTNGTTINLDSLSSYTGAKFRGRARTDRAGYDVAGVGDVNGDGYDDVLIGSNGSGAYLVYGQATAYTTTTYLDLINVGSSIPGVKIGASGQNSPHYFGQSVSEVGDVNNDGYDDFAIGGQAIDYMTTTTTSSGGDINSGIVSIFYGSAALTNPTYHNQGDIEVYGEFVYTGIAGQLGRISKSSGDGNGDGADDILVAEFGNGSGGYPNTSAYFFEDPTATLDSYNRVRVSDNTLRIELGENSGRNGDVLDGWALTMGDFDGDGLDDIVVANGFLDDTTSAGTDRGGVFIFNSPATDGLETDVSAANWHRYGLEDSDYFGNAVDAGDFNGDGFDDLIIGAPGSDTGGTDNGSIYIYWGRNGWPVQGADNDFDNDGYDATTAGGTDCNDNDASISTAEPERWYDGIDQNCDSLSDYDQDGDGMDSSAYSGSDCDDTNAAINPNAVETCDTVDNNCNGSIDDGVVTTYYLDADGDTYGTSSPTTTGCGLPSGYSTNSTDCNDANASINPGATEVWYNGTDQNCDGQNDYDQDGDGFARNGTTTATRDCNDTNASVYPKYVGSRWVCR